jgi:hypothetical protein
MEAFNASAEMCRLASAPIGRTVFLKTFDDLDSISEFDGIWACASLLHIRRDRINTVLQRLYRALKPRGVMFLSFRLRDGEREQDGRLFNGYDETSFQELLRRNPSFEGSSTWVSDDARPERKNEKWLNPLLRRSGG